MENENTKDLKEYAGRIQRLVDNFQSNIHEHLNEDYVKSTKWSDKLADNVASFVGSWKFINIFMVFLAMWVILNSLEITRLFILTSRLLFC
ncbi:hypothetical protein AB4Z22_34825 [Paenibacillus sp. TAF58]